jgi:hypothetical protein
LPRFFLHIAALKYVLGIIGKCSKAGYRQAHKGKKSRYKMGERSRSLRPGKLPGNQGKRVCGVGLKFRSKLRLAERKVGTCAPPAHDGFGSR